MRVMLTRYWRPYKGFCNKNRRVVWTKLLFTKINIKGYLGDSPLIMRSVFVALSLLDISPLTLRNIYIAKIGAIYFFIWPIYIEVKFHIKMRQSWSRLSINKISEILFMSEEELERSRDYTR